MPQLKVTIEVKDPAILEALAPLIKIAETYDGHLNWSYTRGGDWAGADIKHRDALIDLLLAAAGGTFLVGGGSSHVWIAPLAAADQHAAATAYSNASGGYPDRFVLITDYSS